LPYPDNHFDRVVSSLGRGFFMNAIAQFLKNFEPIEDNIKGLIPDFIEKSGFEAVHETQHFNTVIGTLSLYQAVKPY
jgi:hypothetical protein